MSYIFEIFNIDNKKLDIIGIDDVDQDEDDDICLDQDNKDITSCTVACCLVHKIEFLTDCHESSLCPICVGNILNVFESFGLNCFEKPQLGYSS